MLRSTRSLMARFAQACLVLTLFVSAPAFAQALDPLTDAYTAIIGQGRLWDKGFPNFNDHTIDGATSASGESISNGGMFEGEGFADFGILKAKAKISGPQGGYSRVSSRFNDIFTITNPAVTPGTAGTMRMGFHVEGHSNATYVPNVPIDPGFMIGSVSFFAFSALDDDSSITHNDNLRLQYDGSFLAGDKVAAAPFPLIALSFDVPFVYGDPVAVQVSLYARAEGNPFSGSKPIDSVEVNFFNTAQLVGVVLDDVPNVAIAGQSGFDYASLVAETLPAVPEPSSLALLAVGLTLAARRRRSGS